MKPEGAFDSFTSYRNDFTKKSTEKRMSAKPVYQPSTQDRPFNGTTAYQETFKRWEMPVNESIRHQSTIQLAQGRNVDYNTTSRLDFTEYSNDQSGRQSIIPKETRLFGGGRFLDETTNQRDFPPKEGGPEKSAKPVHHVLKSSEPFDHKTTFQQNFPQWTEGNQPSRQSIVPKETPLFGGGKFLNETTNQRDFPHKEGGPEKSAKPVHHVLKSDDPFDHKTTFQQNFPWWTDGKQAKICRPKEAPQQVDQPFEGVTTHNMMYKAWDVA